jgi:TrpR-related protein YerC/YecD
MQRSQINTKQLNQLYEAMLKLETKAEYRKFMRDLCTLSELKVLAERWAVAKKIDTGVPYRQIAQEVPSSTATVTRIANWLHHGEGGYKLLLHRLRAK